MLHQFRADHEAQKAKQRGAAVSEPMSEEKAEYWRKIAALKDSPEITAEQQAFRRKIEMEMPKDRKEAAE